MPKADPHAGRNESAVTKLLSTLGDVDVALSELAVTLAKSLDDGVGMATAAVARELRATLTELRESAAATQVKITKADELRARRKARIADAKDQERSAVDNVGR
jgi:hypothetical protein